VCVGVYIYSLAYEIQYEKLAGLSIFFLNANRKRKEWDVYEPIVDLLSNEEVDALEAKEERNFR